MSFGDFELLKFLMFLKSWPVYASVKICKFGIISGLFLVIEQMSSLDGYFPCSLQVGCLGMLQFLPQEVLSTMICVFFLNPNSTWHFLTFYQFYHLLYNLLVLTYKSNFISCTPNFTSKLPTKKVQKGCM